MSLNSLGDAAQTFQLRRNNFTLKSQLSSLANELSTGEVNDRVKALGGDTKRFSSVDYSLSVISSQIESTRETAITLTAMQTSLESLNDRRADMSNDLLLVSRDSPKYQIEEAARNSENKFGDFVSILNTKSAGRSLFAGNAVDGQALTASEDMLANLTAFVGAATSAPDILAAVNNWFDDPAGGFETMGYLGDTGNVISRRLDANNTVELNARADNSGLRSVLKGAAVAALVSRLPALDQTTQAELLFDAGIQLQSSATDMVQIQARLGYAEAEVDRISTEQSSEQSALNILRNELVQADPFETATALQEVQLQLETHYAMTARLSRLSLVEYLR